jgi:hypothetical protein
MKFAAITKKHEWIDEKGKKNNWTRFHNWLNTEKSPPGDTSLPSGKSSNQFYDFCENPEKLTDVVKNSSVFSQKEKTITIRLAIRNQEGNRESGTNFLMAVVLKTGRNEWTENECDWDSNAIPESWITKKFFAGRFRELDHKYTALLSRLVQTQFFGIQQRIKHDDRMLDWLFRVGFETRKPRKLDPVRS